MSGEVLYPPKEIDFDQDKGFAVCQYLLGDYRAHDYLRGIIVKVGTSLMAKHVGVYQGERFPNSSEEMREDPYLQRHYTPDFYILKDRNLFEEALKEGKTAGLWTFHGDSGRRTGMPAARGGLIRINPKAFPWLLNQRYQNTGTSYELEGYVDPSHPGWRKSYPNRDSLSLLLIRLWNNDHLEIKKKKGEDPILLHRLRKQHQDPHRLYMEALLADSARKGELVTSVSDEPLSDLYPGVPLDVLRAEGFSFEQADNFSDALEKAQRHYEAALKDLKEKRLLARHMEEMGGTEGLLSRMGQALISQLQKEALNWSTIGEPLEGDGNVRRFRRSIDPRKEIALLYLAGKIPTLESFLENGLNLDMED